MGVQRLAARASLAAALGLLLVGACAPATGAPQAPQLPTCQVTLSQDTFVAKPKASVSDSETFAGTVDVDLGSLSGARALDIVASTTVEGWTVSVQPPTENVTGVEQIPFNATLVVPAAESATVRGTFAVTASFLAVPGAPGSRISCADDIAVSVEQYYGVSADLENARKTVKTGATGITVPVIVHNLGNGRDTFSVDLEDRLDWQQRGFLTNLPIDVILDPDAETNATFTLNASSSVPDSTHEMVLTVRSQAQPQTQFVSVGLTLVVDNIELLSQLPDLSTLVILGAVVAAAVAFVGLRRRAKRRQARRQARMQLQKVLRQRREAGGVDEAADAEDAAPGPVEPAPQAPDTRVRVKVKAPPRP